MVFSISYETGDITVDKWDKEVVFTYDFLALQNIHLERKDDDIFIAVANARAHYRIVEDRAQFTMYKALFVDGLWYE